MNKIPWLNFKSCDFSDLQNILQPSFALNQLTNGGPVVQELELYFLKLLHLDPGKRVIAVVNASSGLNALVAGINWVHQHSLKYATQAYTFPCAGQGELKGSQIVDIDEEYGPDLNEISTEVEGLLVTNLFGHVQNLQKYLDWAEINQKILLFDNATVPLSHYQGKNVLNYGVGSIVSLHHTKPFGFGEGGLVIVDEKYENAVRKCINFGFQVSSLSDEHVTWSPYGMNGKMSDISAAAILSYLKKNQKQIVSHHLHLYQSFEKKLLNIPSVSLFPHWGSSTPFVNCFALICDHEITNHEIAKYELNNIQAKKYYTPLKFLSKSNYLFKHILCLPCHLDVTEATLDRYLELLSK
jgi:dTDP-4-amino-4,6-dideoxygalactose transaminase